MRIRHSFTAIILGIMTAMPVAAQEYYSQDRVPSKTFQNVGFTRAAVEDDADEPTIDELREQLKRMELRLRELENDVEDNIEEVDETTKATEKASESVDSRLKDLEKSFEKQSESIDSIETTIPGLVHAGHKKPKMQLFGRIHLDYWAFPQHDPGIETLEEGNPQDRVAFRRMRIGVKGDLNDNMFYKYEGEFAGGVASSYRDAYIGFKDLPAFNTVILGNHKRPYGLDHLNSSRYNVFTERPFIVEAFNQDSRRLGISSNGVSEDEQWNWRYGLWNQQLTQTSAGWVSDHYNGEVAARLARTAWYDESSDGRGYFHYAIAGSYGIPDGRPGSTINGARYRTRPEGRSDNRWIDTGRITFADSNALLGLETVLNVGAFQLTAEYMNVRVDRNDIGADVVLDGGYVQAAYFLTGEHTPWVRKTGTLGRVKPFENFFSVRDCDGNRGTGLGAWQVAARYSYANLTDEDVLGGDAESLTLGVNWWWNPNARVQFNYIFGEIERDPLASGNYEIFGVRWMVDF